MGKNFYGTFAAKPVIAEDLKRSCSAPEQPVTAMLLKVQQQLSHVRINDDGTAVLS